MSMSRVLMLKTVLICKVCTVHKSASQDLFAKPYLEKRKYFAPPPPTTYKNCIRVPVPWVVACWLGGTPLFEKDWYIRTLLRILQAEIENTNPLLKNLPWLSRKNFSSFLRVSTVTTKTVKYGNEFTEILRKHILKHTL